MWLQAVILPFDRLACEAVEIEGPVERLLDILFARPDDLDGPVDLLRDAHRLGDVVYFEPPAETAADQMVVDDNLLGRQPGHLRRDPLGAGDHLIADPDLAGVGANVHGAVHRLHRRMGEERHVIGRLEFRSLAQSLGDVAGRFRDGALSLACGDESVQHVGRRHVGVRPFVPRDVEGVEALLGGPHVIADDRDEIVENDDLPHPGHGLWAAASFTRATLPPNTGQLASVAIFTPGGRASMP